MKDLFEMKSIEKLAMYYGGLFEFLESIESIDVTEKNNLSILNIKTSLDFRPIKSVRYGKHLETGELYYYDLNNSLFTYGLNGKDQWWSSRCDVINHYFKTNMIECFINGYGDYAIDKTLHNLILFTEYKLNKGDK